MRLFGLTQLLLQDLLGELVIVIVLGDDFAAFPCTCRQIIFRQMARIGTRIGQHLMAFVQRLRQASVFLAEKPKRAVGFALQAGQVEQCQAPSRWSASILR